MISFSKNGVLINVQRKYSGLFLFIFGITNSIDLHQLKYKIRALFRKSLHCLPPDPILHPTKLGDIKNRIFIRKQCFPKDSTRIRVCRNMEVETNFGQ